MKVTDTMVEAALDEWMDIPWRSGGHRYVAKYKKDMRRALEAAMRAAGKETREGTE